MIVFIKNYVSLILDKEEKLHLVDFLSRPLHHVRRHAVGSMDDSHERVYLLRRVIVAHILEARQINAPGTHVPAYGEHLVIVKLQSAEQHHHERLLAVAHREILVRHLVALAVLPLSELVLALLHGALVNVRLAYVMQQRGDDDALALHLRFERRLQRLHRLPQGERRLAGVERVDHEASLRVEVVPGGSRGSEETEPVDFLYHVVDAVTAGGFQQTNEFLLILIKIVLHIVYIVFDYHVCGISPNNPQSYNNLSEKRNILPEDFASSVKCVAM